MQELNPTAVAACAPRVPRPRTSPDRTSRLGRCLVELATSGEWLPAATFLDTTVRALRGPRGWPDGVTNRALWRSVSRRVAAELDRLGLYADVWSTRFGPLPLAEHDPDTAGLVRVFGPGGLVAVGWPLSEAERAVAVAAGIAPHRGLPDDLRGFCGQSAPYQRPLWLDHVMTGLDRDGAPVLTFEPYGLSGPGGQEMAAEIIAELDALPVDWSVGPGPRGGKLVTVRHDHRAEPLAAEWEPPAPPLPTITDAQRAQLEANLSYAATLTRPTRPLLLGLVRKVTRAPRLDRPELLVWAIGKLIGWRWAGHLSEASVCHLAGAMLDELNSSDSGYGIDNHDLDYFLRQGRASFELAATRARSRALAEAS